MAVTLPGPRPPEVEEVAGPPEVADGSGIPGVREIRGRSLRRSTCWMRRKGLRGCALGAGLGLSHTFPVAGKPFEFGFRARGGVTLLPDKPGGRAGRKSKWGRSD